MRDSTANLSTICTSTSLKSTDTELFAADSILWVYIKFLDLIHSVAHSDQWWCEIYTTRIKPIFDIRGGTSRHPCSAPVSYQHHHRRCCRKHSAGRIEAQVAWRDHLIIIITSCAARWPPQYAPAPWLWLLTFWPWSRCGSRMCQNAEMHLSSEDPDLYKYFQVSNRCFMLQ